MPKIIIKNNNKIIDYIPSKNLLRILLDNEVFIDNPCNGKGSCGKCKVKILKGNISHISETEEKLLKPEEIKLGVRVACLINPEDDIEIELMQKERKHKILTSGYIPEFKLNPSISKKVIEIKKPSFYL